VTKVHLTEQLSDSLTSPALVQQKLSEILLKEVICVDREWPLDQILSRFVLRSGTDLYDPVLVTEEGQLSGCIPAFRLFKQIMEK
jgi:hypothetical protein